MRLDTISRACLLALGGFVSAAFAQDAAYLKQLDAKSAQMKKCADIARAMEKIPVPAKHAENKNRAANAALAKDKDRGPAPDVAHLSFESQVKRMDMDLQKCGDDLYKDMAQVEGKMKPFMEGAKKAKMAEAEQKAVSQSLGGYMKAKQDLQEAIELLSKDRQMQAYVHKTLTEHYLNQKH